MSNGDNIPPVGLIAAPTGSYKSTQARANAVRFVGEHPGYSVVILMDRHRLGDEQIKLLQQEHPNGEFNAAVWRGRWAWDPEVGSGREKTMCRRPEAKEVEKCLLSVEHTLCKQGRGKNALYCPLYDICGYQRQKLIEANIWFAAHEMMVHEKPKVFGKIGWIIIDENPIDALIFGIDPSDPFELALDALNKPVPHQLSRLDAFYLQGERDDLYEALHNIKLPTDPHKGAAASKADLRLFEKWPTAHHNIQLEWRGKVEPEITPEMQKGEVLERLNAASGNGLVAKLVKLWELVDAAVKADHKKCGRVQVHDSPDGRVIRMVGLNKLAKGWDRVAVMICDATAEPELLRAIWPQLRGETWPPITRSNNVEIYQVVDKSVGKWAIAVEAGEKEKEQARAARRMYAALLTRALQYREAIAAALQDNAPAVAAITYKLTEEWIRKNCCVPKWLKLAHFGDVTGTNEFSDVAALFEIGRPLPPSEAVTRQAEALFGGYIGERDYVGNKGHILIKPLEAGYDAVEVDVWRHPNPNAERLRRMICQGSLIQAEGRARAALRGVTGKSLEIHRWTDVPLPELGPVIPLLWEEVAIGLDGVMLATGGVWVENCADAERVYGDAEAYGQKILTAAALWKERERRVGDFELFNNTSNAALKHYRYRRAGSGKSTSRAVFLTGAIANPQAWLESKLGPLASWEPMAGCS